MNNGRAHIEMVCNKCNHTEIWNAYHMPEKLADRYTESEERLKDQPCHSCKSTNTRIGRVTKR